MNIDKAIERIAANNTSGAIWEWAENIAQKQDELHTATFSILGRMCDECPFRNNKAMGGCIAASCPVHKVDASVHTLTEKARAIAKKARNRKYNMDKPKWSPSR